MDARNNLRTAADSSDRTLTLSRVLDAPRSLVFAAWTQKEHLDRWSAPGGLTIAFSEGDLRPGGKWRVCMRAADGIEHWLSGVYREIVPDELLVFTHAWENDGTRGHETVVTVRFAYHDGKTKLTLEQSGFDSTASRDGHAGGWSDCLDILAGYLSTAKGAAD